MNGELTQFTDSRNLSKTRYFANGAEGAPLTVVQGQFDGQSGRLTAAQAFSQAVSAPNTFNNVKAQHFFFANGQQVGSFGQLSDASGTFTAHFDTNFTEVSDVYPASAPAEVVVQTGETLRIIAARVFGDANLWYLIAEENGLTSPTAELEAGTVLRIPNEVVSLSNTSTSFKPFDVSEALGDTTPTQPMPAPRKKKGCGVIGQILVVVVAIVVTIATQGAATKAAAAAVKAIGLTGAAASTTTAVAGAALAAAAGSIASQGVAIATGLQDSFSWKSVAASALTAGLLKGTPLGNVAGADGAIAGSQLLGQAAQGLVSNAVGQGVNIALGLQDKFSWAAVAASAVAAPIASSIGIKAGQIVGEALKSNFAGQLVGQAAYGLTMAATRSAFVGGKIDYAQIAADAFGNVLGNSIVDAVTEAAINRRTNRILERARITGDPGDTQQSRIMVSSMVRAGGSDADILDFVGQENVRSSLLRLDAVLSGGTSIEVASDRAAGTAARALRNQAPEDLGIEEIVVVGKRMQGPSGNSIIADTISGGVGLADSFVSYAESHPVTAELAFIGVSAVLGGPTKTILRRIAGKAGDSLIDRGADAFGGVVRGVVTNIATHNKWTVALSVAGYSTNADASTIGATAGGLGSLAVEVGLGGIGQVIDRVKDIRSTVRGGTYVLRDAEGVVVRSGRTRDLARRQAEHSRDPELSRYNFEPVHRTDDYAQQRGLEQLLHDQYNPPLNRIRPINPANPRRQTYEDAAQQFLRENSGQ